MQDVEGILGGEPGLYWMRRRPSHEELERIVGRGGPTLFRVNGSKAQDKRGLLREAASGLGCPGYFGGNWDALEECVTDLSWAPAKGYVLLYEGYSPLAGNDPDGWETFTKILQSAVEYWRGEGVPMQALLVP